MKCNNCGTDISANAWSFRHCGSWTAHIVSIMGRLSLAIALLGLLALCTLPG